MKNKQFNFTTIFKGFLTAFNINHGLIPTLRDLLINPAIVIHYYIEGKIDKYGYNKYFSPGRFFVTVLAILSVFTFFSSYSSDVIYEYFVKGLDAQLAGMKTVGEEAIIINSVNKVSIKVVMFFFNNPMFTFLLLIIPCALSTRLLFKSENYNLAKHFVVNIYCFCFIALATGILSVCFNQEEYLMYSFQQLEDARNNIKTDVLWKFEFYSYSFYLIPILYYFYAFKNIFNISWISAIFKTMGSLILSFTTIFFTFLIAVLIFVL